MNWLYLAAGLLLLFLGRKAIWMFVAIVGFLLGVKYAPQLLPDQSQSVILTVSLIAGLLGALLAVLLQKFAVGLTGLLAGGYVTYYFLQTNAAALGQSQWILIALGALVGAILAGSLFDWAMILVTSVTGAVLIDQGLNIQNAYSYIVIIGLVLLGIIVQTKMKAKG
jgi:MFS family permease